MAACVSMLASRRFCRRDPASILRRCRSFSSYFDLGVAVVNCYVSSRTIWSQVVNRKTHNRIGAALRLRLLVYMAVIDVFVAHSTNSTEVFN